MEKNKQTAVEWLVNEFNQKIDYIPVNKWDMIRDIIKQALAIEKEQIKADYNQGYRDGESDAVDIHFVNMDVSMFANAENYYDETYNKE